MSRFQLPDFALEVYFSHWEFAARHHLTASDAESMTIKELLALAGEPESGDATETFLDLRLGYLPTWGTDPLREAIAATYESIQPSEVLAFAGAGEAIFWAMQLLLEPGDHAVVTVPNYQSLESVPVATGVAIDGLPLWSGAGDDLEWVLDLDRLRAVLRPNTRVVAVNFPNNPTGLVPDLDTWKELVGLCDERGIRLVSDEVYRGLELEPARRVPQAADLSPRAVSLNVMSKAYGLPGLRVGWTACKDREVLARLERAKHYTSICNSGPSEQLATLALQNADAVLDRNREILLTNAKVTDTFMNDFAHLFDYRPPDGGCVAFPHYKGPEGVEVFCRRAVEECGVLLLPSSLYKSALGPVPSDRFRIGIGRRAVPAALEALREHLESNSN